MKSRDRDASRKRGKEKYRFTREDCRRGYQAALARCGEDWNLFAWIFRKVRKHYAKKGA